jgi:acetolactate synthase-1/2/3 large subunit
MKLSDYVFKFLEKYTDTVFLLSGGGIMHLVDSLGKSKLQAICCHHEQAAATAAESYSRILHPEKLGVTLVTTGPGGTNAITGAADAWLDSIPMLIINGQVKTDNITPRKYGVPVVRAMGFQELNVIDLVKPISKYVATIEHPEDIRYHLEKAIYLAKHGRPGPSWVEIPLDIQAAEIDPKKLRGYIPTLTLGNMFTKPKIPMKTIIDKLNKAKRPLLLAGNGIRLAGGEKILWKLIKKLKINVVTPIFTADDLVTYDYPYFLGQQGMPGNETANWAIDNCDLLLVVGDRLQLTQVSYDYQNFATQATKIMVDIDENELHKKTLSIDIPVCCDAKIFLEELDKQKIKLHRWNIKVKTIDPGKYQGKKEYVNVYRFFSELNKHLKGCNVATDGGMTSLTTHQALKLKRGQRFITSVALGHLGAGLPLAIGVSVATGKKPTVCVEGDGGLMLNIHELQTMLYHQLPIKLFIFNNNGYYSIRNTHLNYFKKVFAADPESGVGFPNYEKLIKAWGFSYVKIASDKDLDKVKEIMNFKGPIVCEVMIDPAQPMLPKWSAGQLCKK